ncbi:hypothetical protein HGRIS_006063 [Hohenbuehelia grisea]|uniref:Uncharacterized protein n=1 Tax=Hohenbuehelia grisea TaxID=104357 RepID=A0ABR3K087_9AGAR
MSDSPDIALEHSFYWGILISAMLYGVEIYMYLHSTYLFLSRDHARGSSRPQFLYIIIGFLMLVFISIAGFANFVFIQFMYIDHRDAEGGPLGYFAANSTVWWQVLGTVSGEVSNYLGDALLIYRCYIIWNGGYAIIGLPVLLWLGSIAMGTITAVQSAIPGSDFFRQQTNFAIPWVVLSVALNLFCTAVIALRLLKARSAMRDVGALQDGELKTYTGVIAILVESALPFSILGIVFAITLGQNNAASPSLAFIWGTFCALSPQMIIYRVAIGRAWSRELASRLSSNTLAFAHDKSQPTFSTMADSQTRTAEKTTGSTGFRSVVSLTQKSSV